MTDSSEDKKDEPVFSTHQSCDSTSCSGVCTITGNQITGSTRISGRSSQTWAKSKGRSQNTRNRRKNTRQFCLEANTNLEAAAVTRFFHNRMGADLSRRINRTS